MRKVSLMLLFMAVAFLVVHMPLAGCGAETDPPGEGEVLPDFTLSLPDDLGEKQYLGQDEKGSFKIPQIKADLVIVEIFSMYCPYCQKEAPVVNELYQAINSRPDIKSRVKMIGIGVGNTPYEVKLFKDRYQVPFPLFPDSDFAIHKLLGEVRTPFFLAIRIADDRSHKIIYSELGSFGDPQDFLQTLLQKSQLEGGN
jgi:peroxiredoxin